MVNLEQRIQELEAEIAELRSRETGYEKTDDQLRIFKALADSSVDSILIGDAELNLSYANRAAYEMFGYDVATDELMGMNALIMWPEAEIPRMQQEIIPQIMNGGFSGDVHQQRKDGSQFYVNATAFTIKDEQGQVVNLVAVLRDITERKKMEAERSRLVSILRNMEDMVVLAEPQEGKAIYMNEAGLHMLGCDSPDDVLNRQMGPFQPEDAAEHFEKTVVPILMKGGRWRGETTLRRKDGTVFPVDYNGFMLYDELNRPYAIAAIIADITRRQENEVALKTQREFLRQVIDAIPSVIYVKDWNGIYSLANKALASSYDLTPDDIIGKTDLELGMKLQEYEHFLQVNREIIASGQPNEVPDSSFTDPNTGEVRYFQAFNVPLKGEDGEYNQLLGVAMDVTEKRQAQEERERLQREIIDAQKQALSELSTPIIPIMDGIIVMPLIGSIDTHRSRDITRSLLSGISRYRARTVILDITGVPIVDSGVADHLNKTIQAARLKGAQTIVTGISDAVAETIVDLGIDWSDVDTLRDLQTGLINALKGMGIQFTKH